jgi:hypothetical protein
MARYPPADEAISSNIWVPALVIETPLRHYWCFIFRLSREDKCAVCESPELFFE